MIVIRQIFQAKYGKAGELAAIMKDTPRMAHLLKQPGWRALTGLGWRVLTDISGPFDTVILEFEVSSLAEWERMQNDLLSDAAFRDVFSRAFPLIESGRREIYRIEAQG